MATKNVMAIVISQAPYLLLRDELSKELTVPTVLPVGSGNGGGFNADSTKLAVVHTTSPYITIYNTSDWSKIPNPSILPAGSSYGCAFSPDNSKLAVVHATSPFITIYNTSDWSKVANPPVLPAGLPFSCAFSPDNSKLAVGHNTSPFITIYNTSDWSTVNLFTLPANIGNGCAFSPDNSKLAIAHNVTPYITIYNTSDWSKISPPSVLPTGVGYGCAFSPDNSKLAVAHATPPYITIYNTSDWSKISLSSPPVKLSTSYGRSVSWRSNSVCILTTDGVPGVVEVNVSSGLVASQIDAAVSVAVAVLSSSPKWSISGTIDESLAADTWTAYVHDVVTGQLLNSAVFTGTGFSVILSSPDPVSVTVAAHQGSIWEASTYLTANTKIYPTNPTATPYYYTVSEAGMTASSEPVWPITAGGTVTNGGVTFTRVERLIQPVTQSPLIPVPL